MNDQQKTQRGQEMPDYTEEQARAYFERMRWPDGPVCHHCGSKSVARMGGKGGRKGLYHCPECREQTTVTLGSVMENTHLPLAVWAKAFHYMSASKKGVSALYLQRTLGLGSYRTAWFLAHRIRKAMEGAGDDGKPLQGVVECDETYVGGRRLGKGQRAGWDNKTAVVSLVEKGGRKRSRVVAEVTGANLKKIMKEETAGGAEIHTDTNPVYKHTEAFRSIHRVNHTAKEYVLHKPCGRTVTTNEVEGSFGLLKRGIMGQFHHVSRKHLPRYCAEFDARWTLRFATDTERRDAMVKGAAGKRLTYYAVRGEKRVKKSDNPPGYTDADFVGRTGKAAD